MVAGGIKHRNNESEGPAYIGDSKPCLSDRLVPRVLEALKDHQTKINQKGNDKERLNIKLGTSEKYALHKFLCPGEDGKYCYITIVLERKIFWPNTYDDLAEGRLKGDPMDIRLDKY
eukprot:Platyproteum_vivax@DN1897_c0_g1_i2.p1